MKFKSNKMSFVNEIKEKIGRKENRKDYLFRFICFIGGFSIFWISNFFRSNNILLPNVCISDNLFKITQFINDYLNENKIFKILLMIFSGIFLDFLLFTISVFFIAYAKTMRSFFAFFCLYFIRSITQVNNKIF